MEIIYPKNIYDVSTPIPIPIGHIVLPCLLVGSIYLMSTSFRAINKMLLQKEELDTRFFPFIMLNGAVIMNTLVFIARVTDKIKILDYKPVDK